MQDIFRVLDPNDHRWEREIKNFDQAAGLLEPDIARLCLAFKATKREELLQGLALIDADKRIQIKEAEWEINRHLRRNL